MRVLSAWASQFRADDRSSSTAAAESLATNFRFGRIPDVAPADPRRRESVPKETFGRTGNVGGSAFDWTAVVANPGGQSQRSCSQEPQKAAVLAPRSSGDGRDGATLEFGGRHLRCRAGADLWANFVGGSAAYLSSNDGS